MKRTIRTLTLAVTLLLFAILLPQMKAEAAATIASGTYGDNLTWKIDSNYELTISGTGDMDEATYSYNYPWEYDMYYRIKSVVIKDGVTSIASQAFKSYTALTSVVIPDSVTSIASQAFYNCSCLTSVTIGNSVTSIGYRAFFCCSGLKSIYINDLLAWCSIKGLNYLTGYTTHDLYLNGELVKALVIPDSVTSIGYAAFCSCSNLTSVTIGNSVTSIGEYAFCNCSNLTSVTIGNSVTSIGEYAFSDCSGLTSVTIPDSVTSIAGYAFHNCSSLTDVYYLGNDGQWSDMIVRIDGNAPFINAETHFLGGHDYLPPVWTWSGFESAILKLVCSQDDDTQTIPATIASETVDPSCTEEGQTVFMASAEFDGRKYTDTKTVAIPALGHTFNAPSWTWNDDLTEAVAAFHCSVCGFDDTVTVTVTPERREPTHTKAGYIRAEAALTYEGAEYNDSKEVILPAVGHTYGAPVWNWTAEDAAQLTFTCDADGDEQVVNATVTQYGERVEPTCGVDGHVTFIGIAYFKGARYTDTHEVVLPATGLHTDGETVRENEVATSCSDEGSYDEVVYCTVCGQELSRIAFTVEKLAHTPGHAVEENRQEPTCTAVGFYDEAVYCTVCGEELSRVTNIIDKLGHTPGEAVEENRQEPTCIAFGLYDEAVYCTVCGEELSRVTNIIDMLAHTPGEAVEENRQEPTCTAVGFCDDVVYCSVCGKELNRQTKILDKLAHTPGETVHENEVAATCTKEGSYDEVVYCSVCGEELSREQKQSEKVAHTPGEAVRENEVTSTCTAEGSYEEVVYCSVCGEELSRELKQIDKLAHTLSDVVRENEIATTCSAEGSYDEVVYCSVCGQELSRETKTIEKLAHSPGETVRENEVEPTCSAEGSYDEVVYCSVCGQELSRETKTIEKLAHTPNEAVRENEIAPTCSAEGSYDEVVYCTVCGQKLSCETKTIVKLAHTPGEAVRENEVAATCTAAGNHDIVVYCTICKTELSRIAVADDALGHDWSAWTVTTPATEDQDGVETRTCSRCGETETRPVPRLVPEIEEAGITGGSLRVRMNHKREKATEVFVASYDENGKLLSVELTTIKAGDDLTQLDVDTGTAYTVFAVDDVTFAPLCAPVTAAAD